MAVIYAPQAAFNWSDDWCDDDDGVQDTGQKPQAADVCVFTANSGDCTLDENSAALGGLSMAGYPNAKTLAFGANDIDVNGDTLVDGTLTSSSGVLYCSGDFTKTADMTALPNALTVELDGTGSSASNSVLGGDLIINTAGTITLGDDNYWTDYTHTLGSIIGTEAVMYVAGNLSATTVGTLTALTVEQTGTGNADWNESGDNLTEYRLGASADVTMTAHIYADILTFATGSQIDAGSALLLIAREPVTNPCISATGTVGSNISILIRETGSISNSGAITTNGAFQFQADDAVAIFTQTGVMNVANLEIYPNIDTASSQLVIGVTGCDLGAVVLGKAGTARAGKLDLGDSGYQVWMDSVADGSSAAASANTLDFGISRTTIHGSFDLTSLTVDFSRATIFWNFPITNWKDATDFTITKGRRIPRLGRKGMIHGRLRACA